MYIRRYRDTGDRLSNRQHIFQIHRVRDIISLYEIHTLSLPAPGLMHYCRASLIYAICVDSHALLPSILDLRNLCRFPCTLAHHSSIHAIGVVYHGLVSLHILSPCCYAPRSRTAHSHEYPSDTMRGAVECR
jgi:hypothetical protein